LLPLPLTGLLVERVIYKVNSFQFTRSARLVLALQSNFSRRKITLRYAALTGKGGSGKVLAVVSGGNIDLAKFTELVSASQPHPRGTGTPA
jgi:hypothetical protein